VTRKSLASTFAELLSKHEAEGVSHRVEKHAKRVAGLEVGLSRAHRERMGFIFVEVIAMKIKVQLLWHGSLGPGGRHELGNLLKAQHPSTFVQYFDPVHVLGFHVPDRLDLKTQQRGVKVREWDWLRAVQRRERKLDGHCSVPSGCWPPRMTVIGVPLTGSMKVEMALPGTGISLIKIVPPWRVTSS